MRNGQKIKPHCHRSDKEVEYYSALSGNLVIDVDEESYTFYQDHSILNKNGRMVLFPSNMLHWTSLYTGNSTRITIAFDIRTYIDWKEDVFDDAKDHWVKV